MISPQDLSVLQAPIKCRIWVFGEEKMYNSDNGFGMGADGSWWQYADQGYWTNNAGKKPEFLLMPFIGFKDTSPEEQDLYVGDIVSHGYQSDRGIFTSISVIIPSPNEACFYFGILESPQINCGRITKKMLYGNNQVCEKLGNVFENYNIYADSRRSRQ